MFAHDAARHFERIVFVEEGGRFALAVVDRDRDFGVIAPRAFGIAGEDDVVHLAGAHRLVRGFAHDPAHGFHQIGFATAVRTDDAGQPGFDLKVGWFDEGLETDQAQPRELHSVGISMFLAAAGKEIVESSRREILSPVAREACCIGAENESSGLRAQLPRRIIQTFRCRALPGRLRNDQFRRPDRSEKPLSFLEIGVDFLGHLVDRKIADHLLAVDEESGGRIDPELVDGVVAHRLDAVEHLLIRQALFE